MNFQILHPIELSTILADKQFNIIEKSSKKIDVLLHGYKGTLSLNKQGLVSGFSSNKYPRFVRYFVKMRKAKVAAVGNVPYGGKNQHSRLKNYEKKHNCTLYSAQMYADSNPDKLIKEKIKLLSLPARYDFIGKGKCWLIVDNNQTEDEREILELLLQDLIPVIDYGKAWDMVSQATYLNLVCEP